MAQQVAKLSDREGGPIQRELEGVSYAIYRSAPVAPGQDEIAERAWQMIPPPKTQVTDLDLGTLNWFITSARWYRTRAARLAVVLDALRAIDKGLKPPERVVSTRHAQGLPLVPEAARSSLMKYLVEFEAFAAAPVA